MVAVDVLLAVLMITDHYKRALACRYCAVAKLGEQWSSLELEGVLSQFAQSEHNQVLM